MGTAVADDLIRRNPCQIKNGGTVHTPERPTATIPEVFAPADAGQRRYRALILLADHAGGLRAHEAVRRAGCAGGGSSSASRERRAGGTTSTGCGGRRASRSGSRARPREWEIADSIDAMIVNALKQGSGR
jgi:hypothetical protein